MLISNTLTISIEIFLIATINLTYSPATKCPLLCSNIVISLLFFNSSIWLAVNKSVILLSYAP